MALTQSLPNTFNISFTAALPIRTEEVSTSGFFFEEANEGKFLDLLKENKFFDRQMTEFTHSPINALEDRVRRIVKVLDSQREHDSNDLKPFSFSEKYRWQW